MNDKDFQELVWDYFAKHKRAMPWREDTHPYRILVSEIMLQQTQVHRVIPKFQEFLKSFPTITSLAAAPLSEVISVWSGLGYNRRARFLHESAKCLVDEYNGSVPNDQLALVALPGIGENTASAIRAYAFNEPVVFVETNIRAAIIHHFFDDHSDAVTDREVLDITARVLDTETPREWYWALMDYGSYVKKAFGNPARRSKHHARQSTFEGSQRQLRGIVLRLLIDEQLTNAALAQRVNDERLSAVLIQLENEKMISRKGDVYSLAS